MASNGLPPERQQRYLDNAPTLSLGGAVPVTCEQLSALKVPALLVRGEKSPWQEHERFLACLPKASEFAVIPGAEKLRAGALQIPVLLYVGKQDLWDWDVDAAHATLQGSLTFFDIAGAKNPRVKFIVINGAGHFVYREQPEQFNADLIHFIECWNNRSAARENARRWR